MFGFSNSYNQCLFQIEIVFVKNDYKTSEFVCIHLSIDISRSQKRQMLNKSFFVIHVAIVIQNAVVGHKLVEY